MILDRGEKLLIIHRRLFDGDPLRVFIGVVEEFAEGLVRVAGHTWLRDHVTGQILRKAELRRKVIPVASGASLVYVLDANVDLDAITFVQHADHRLWMVDGGSLEMDLTEHVIAHH